MKKTLALLGAISLAFTTYPSFAENNVAKESYTKQGINFRNADPIDGILITFDRGKIRPGADLMGANLERAPLNNAKLMDANLMNANLMGANLKGANLKGAKLNGAKLNGAIIDKKALKGAKIAPTQLVGMTVM